MYLNKYPLTERIGSNNNYNQILIQKFFMKISIQKTIYIILIILKKII